jgi:hypothetical protein
MKGSSSFPDNEFTYSFGRHPLAYPRLTSAVNSLCAGALLLIIPDDSFHLVIAKAFIPSLVSVWPVKIGMFHQFLGHAQQTKRTDSDGVTVGTRGVTARLQLKRKSCQGVARLMRLSHFITQTLKSGLSSQHVPRDGRSLFLFSCSMQR